MSLSVPQQTSLIGQDRVAIAHGELVLEEEGDAGQVTGGVCSREPLRVVSMESSGFR